ncbi:CRE-CRN-7 protein [Caenorhabditis remanei]|uniref:CRE-CRN-7 protein n=1 Tax=Caenorhabditis remanei TaxID=31234 RepID=E3LT03_CAERE|nr:CRE-CRN-7 protein [Caenorhabditis remanei]
MRQILTVFIITVIFKTVNGKIQCKNMRGKSVDWFVVYKLPKLSGSGTTGKEFVYIDSESSDWTRGNDINDEQVAVGATISQAYSADKSSNFLLMYSDDDPIKEADSYRGHAKGVSLFDSTTGFWLIHSVPNFPPIKSYSYPSTAEKYGQSFFCSSMEVQHLAELAEHWKYIQATPYVINLPDKFGTRFPTLKNVQAKQSLTRSATQFWISKPIKTVQGVTLMAYAKHKKFDGDIWNDLISKQNKVTLAVLTYRSWLNGSGDDLHTTCTDSSQTHDVTEMRVTGLNFASSKDHSKWAVSNSQTNPIVCFGDMNRQKSQLKRGGGAVCIQNRNLWQIYHSSVIQVEPCKASFHYSFFRTAIIFIFLVFSVSKI